jgi:hypothetical protein
MKEYLKFLNSKEEMIKYIESPDKDAVKEKLIESILSIGD